MQMIADLHTHTLCATHAYNTFTEMAAAAKEIGYCARLNGQYMEIFKPCLPQTLHGTGDVFVSALCGELMNGKGMPQALKDAAEFCDDCVEKTAKRGESHWYGLAFEDKLKEGRGL